MNFRTYRPGDEEQILGLLLEAFGIWPSHDLDVPPLEHWRWRYLAGPSVGGMVVVGEEQGRIEACVHYRPLLLQAGGVLYRCALGADLAVSTSRRGQGLLRELTRHGARAREAAGVEFVFFESQVPKVVRHYRKNSIELPVERRHLLRARAIGRHLRDQGHAWARSKAAVFSLIRAVGKGASRPPRSAVGDLKVTTVEHLDGRFDELWERLAGHYQLAIHRDRAYLNWRFLDPRGGNYRMRSVTEDADLLGYAVSRIDRRSPDHPQGFLVDLQYLPAHEQAAVELIADAVAHCDEQRVNAMHCIVPARHPVRRLLSAFGFVDTLERSHVFLRPVAPDLRPVFDTLEPGAVWYSYGDLDTI